MRIEVLEDPGLRAAEEALRRGFAQRSAVLVVGRCRAFYEGRGTSRLGEGDRILLVKPDGSVLLHRPTGYMPVNWQPSTSLVEASARGNELLVRAVRDKPREKLEVYFTSVSLIVMVRGMRDEAVFTEYLDEHLIRDLIAEDPRIIEDGLRIVEREKPVGGGFIDLYGVDGEGRPVIIELKRVRAGKQAVVQLKRYVDRFSEELGVRPRGILVAPSIAGDAYRLLSTLGLEYRRINLRSLYRRALMRGRGGLSSYMEPGGSHG